MKFQAVLLGPDRTIFALVINKSDPDLPDDAPGLGIDIYHAFGKETKAAQAISETLLTGLDDQNESIIDVMYILISAVEGLKRERPQIAEMIRKRNIAYIKTKRNEQEGE